MGAAKGFLFATLLSYAYFFISLSAFSSEGFSRRGDWNVDHRKCNDMRAGWSSADALSTGKHQSSKLHFKKRDEENSDDSGEGFFKKLKSYIPGLRRSTTMKPEPETELGYRFQIRLTKRGNTRDKRHIITRIMRFLPDIQWETACEIVDNAWQNDISVVRVLNSKKEAKELQAVLGRADPPVYVEVFDTKVGDLVI